MNAGMHTEAAAGLPVLAPGETAAPSGRAIPQTCALHMEPRDCGPGSVMRACSINYPRLEGKGVGVGVAFLLWAFQSH